MTLRFAQGLGLGGEWGGAVLMVAEHGPEERRGLYSSWPQVGVPAGNLLAAGVLALLGAVLSESAFDSWGWRVPFLLSALLIGVGLWIRLRVEESPLFQELEETGEKEQAPLVKVVKCYPRQLGIAIAARFGVDVAFYTFALFILTYVTEQLGLSKNLALSGVLVGSALQLFLIPYFGVGGHVCHSAMYGPQAAFITELFGTDVRYSGASLGYQVAGVLGGALAPIIAVALLNKYGSGLAVALYVLASLIVTIVAVALARETAAVDLRADRPEEETGSEQRPGLRPVFH